jgi:hypothetical protein
MVGRRLRCCLADFCHNAGGETIGTQEWAGEDAGVALAADARRDASVAHTIFRVAMWPSSNSLRPGQNMRCMLLVIMRNDQEKEC